jgi:pyruvate formate lyase activating enzyme
MIKECRICGEKKEISRELGICVDCIRNNSKKALSLIGEAHRNIKREYNLPEAPPREGVACGFCINNCRMNTGEMGYCGMRENKTGKIVPKSGSEDTAFVECYYDSLPTNCVSMEFCGERETHRKKNLAVFYGACTYDCLSCQNWHYRKVTHTMSVHELASRVDESTACICYFGGDPTPQMLHALKVAESVDVRVCWETNGAFSKGLAKKVGRTAFNSGGTIKVDLKAYSESVNIALCGSSNRNTLSNFEYIYESFHRRDPPILVASTLLVPGYVDEEEISHIASFIADVDPTIPYSLLAFHPQFKMRDLPYTSQKHAYACLNVAQKYLKRVRLGNIWLLR